MSALTSSRLDDISDIVTYTVMITIYIYIFFFGGGAETGHFFWGGGKLLALKYPR